MPIAHTKDNLPLNEYLVQRRKFLKMRFGDLTAKTGIPAKYLKKIEKGDWCDLPSGAYVKGFLRKYAQVVRLDEAELALRYETEWKQICAVPSTTNRKSQDRFDWFKQFSSRSILAIVGVVFVLAYIFWQVSVILEKPNLEINFPKEDTAVSVSNLTVEGQVSLGDALSLNNQPVYPNENGFFKKEIELLAGVNVLEIKAVSRFGKETKIIRKVTYLSESGASGNK